MMVKLFKDSQRLIIIFLNIDSKNMNNIIKNIKSFKYPKNQSIRFFKDIKNLKLTVLLDNNVNIIKNNFIEIIKEYNEDKIPDLEQIKYLKPVKIEYNENAKIEIIDLKDREVKYNKNMKLPKFMPYAGLTPLQALEKDGLNALVSIYLKKDELDPKIYKMTLKCIDVNFNDFVEKTFSNVDPGNDDIKDIKEFIYLIESILPEEIESILNKITFNSLDSFLKYASEFELRSAYASLAKKMLLKFK